jgi:hypothetical protein
MFDHITRHFSLKSNLLYTEDSTINQEVEPSEVEDVTLLNEQDIEAFAMGEAVLGDFITEETNPVATEPDEIISYDAEFGENISEYTPENPEFTESYTEESYVEESPENIEVI